jgi:membrane protein YdbS with pleckstrin-like domain
VAAVASGEKDRPTTVNALVYAFYGLLVLVVLVAVLWLFGVVPGWVVPAVLAVTVIVFVLLWRALDRFRRTLSSGSPSEGPRA